MKAVKLAHKFPEFNLSGCYAKNSQLGVDLPVHLPTIASKKTFRSSRKLFIGRVLTELLIDNIFVYDAYLEQKKRGLFIEEFNRHSRLVLSDIFGYREEFENYAPMKNLSDSLQKALSPQNRHRFYDWILNSEAPEIEISDEDRAKMTLLTNELDKISSERGLGNNSVKRAAHRVGIPVHQAYKLVRLAGYTKWAVRIRPILNYNTKFDRKMFCQHMLHFLENSKLPVLFSDETSVELNNPNTKNLVIWAPEKPEIKGVTTGKSKRVMFSAFVGEGYKFPLRPLTVVKRDKNGSIIRDQEGDPVILNVKVDSAAYIDLILKPLKEDLINAGLLVNGKLQCILMQDGAPAHTSDLTITWMKENFGGLDRIITRTPKKFVSEAFSVWPAHSPDLNPLDFSIWARLKNLLTEKSNAGGYSSEKKMIQEAQELWRNEFSQEYIDNCCKKGFFDRLRRVLNQNGGYGEKDRKRLVEEYNLQFRFGNSVTETRQ